MVIKEECLQSDVLVLQSRAMVDLHLWAHACDSTSRMKFCCILILSIGMQQINKVKECVSCFSLICSLYKHLAIGNVMSLTFATTV